MGRPLFFLTTDQIFPWRPTAEAANFLAAASQRVVRLGADGFQALLADLKVEAAALCADGYVLATEGRWAVVAVLAEGSLRQKGSGSEM